MIAPFDDNALDELLSALTPDEAPIDPMPNLMPETPSTPNEADPVAESVEGIWTRQPEETARAYACFCVYRDQGRTRSLVEAYRQETGKNVARQSSGYWNGWYSRHHWRRRAEAYDAHLDQAKREAEAQKWKDRGAQLVEDQYEAAEAMRKKALQMLAFPLAQQIGGAKAVEGFDTFLEMCDRAIYRGLLTVTLTVSAGRQGAERGSSLVHDEAVDQVAQYYARHLAPSVTMQVAAYAALLRFGEAARPVLPRFAFAFDEPISLEKLIELMDRRFPISRRALYARYGVPEPSDASDAFVMDGAVGEPGGDGATADAGVAIRASGERATLSFPAEDEGRVRSMLQTYLRDRAIQERFSALRSGGLAAREALDVLDEEYPLSRGTLRNIVYSD